MANIPHIEIPIDIADYGKIKRRLEAIRDGVDVILKGFEESERVCPTCGSGKVSLNTFKGYRVCEDCGERFILPSDRKKIGNPALSPTPLTRV